MHKYNFVKQEGIKDCGVACLSMIIKHYGGFINRNRLMEMTKTNKNGTTAYDLVTTLRELGFYSSGIRCDLNKEADKINLPVIAHTLINKSYNHFVVIYEINYKKRYLIVADPALKIKKMSFDEFRQISTNVFIIAFPNKKIEKEKNIPISLFLKKFIKLKQIINPLILVVLIFIVSIIYLGIIKLILNKNTNFNLLFISIFILILKYILNSIKNKKVLNIKLNTNQKLMEESFMDILKLPYTYYRNHTTGEVVSRLNDIDNIKDIIDVVVIIISDIIVMSIAGIILLLISKILFLSVILIIILYILNFIFHFKKIKYALQNLKQSYAILNSFETEAIIAFESIKGQNIEDYFKDNFNNKNSIHLTNLKIYQMLLNRLSNINEIISDLLLLLIIFIGFYLIGKNIINYSDLIIFYTLTNYFISPIFNISNLSLILNEIHISLNRLLDLKYAVKKKRKYKKGDISINNLSFDIDNITILSDLKFKINKGEHIVIKGQSGCGKSTFLKLLKQYYKTDKILIDKENINKLNLKDNITYISQDEFLFTDTLYNNITLNKKIKKEELDKIIDICELTPLIEKDDLKLNQLIEENGFNLSGGERQRVILARALVNIKDYLFIDEGLSEVDINMERIILKKILDKYSDKTILFVTHKESNVDLFDRIIDFDNN